MLVGMIPQKFHNLLGLPMTLLSPEKLLYEGKAKRVYQTQDPAILICQFKDDATAFNAEKRGTILHKGEVNCTVASHLFQYLEQQRIPTHFLTQRSPTEMQVRAVKILLIEVVVRNRAAGTLCKRLGLERGQRIHPPLLEFFYKNDALGDPLITEDHIQLLQLATPEQVSTLRQWALLINQHLQYFYQQCRLELIDFKLEFGVDANGSILLADEISPDTCRLWDLDPAPDGTPRVLDKDLFRFDLGDPAAGYQEVLERVLSISLGTSNANGLL